MTINLVIFLSALFLITISLFVGWFYGTWQCRLRRKPNIDRKWNELEDYTHYWCPWNKTKHYAFTDRDLATPRRRAIVQPEDISIPK